MNRATNFQKDSSEANVGGSLVEMLTACLHTPIVAREYNLFADAEGGGGIVKFG